LERIKHVARTAACWRAPAPGQTACGHESTAELLAAVHLLCFQLHLAQTSTNTIASISFMKCLRSEAFLTCTSLGSPGWCCWPPSGHILVITNKTHTRYAMQSRSN
jgi:hypothetical protein